MLFRLVVDKKGKAVRAVEVRTPTARIGRAHGNDIRIPSAAVSRRHCHLQMEDGLLKVEDLESVNGTYLNGDLITGEAVVRPGDRLNVGPVTFVVEYELTPEALERLRELDYEVVEEGSAEIVVPPEQSADESTSEVRRPKSAKKSKEERDLVPLDEDEEEVVDAEEEAPRADLDEVTWAPSGEGDLRDLLSGLDAGQESIQPRKRPAPRGKPKEDDWPSDRRGPDEATKPKDKGGKRRPKPEE